MTTYISTGDASASKWKELVLTHYPDAKVYKAPEEEGGTLDAWSGDKFVGDWDGCDAPYGRIVQP